jgi:hypothetical protein
VLNRQHFQPDDHPSYMSQLVFCGMRKIHVRPVGFGLITLFSTTAEHICDARCNEVLCHFAHQVLGQRASATLGEAQKAP